MATTFKGSVATCPIFGNDQLSQVLLTIENQIGSRVNVKIRRAVVQCDTVAVLTSVQSQVKAARATAISGGYIMPKSVLCDMSLGTSSSKVVVRTQLQTSNYLSATLGDILWQQYAKRLHTAVRQQNSDDNNLLPMLINNSPLILYPGESLAFAVVSASTATNKAINNNWFVNLFWQEDEIGTTAINGTITSGGTPVAGAHVAIFEADDIALTNISFVEVVTTNSLGQWASTTTNGKTGVAFTQEGYVNTTLDSVLTVVQGIKAKTDTLKSAYAWRRTS